MNMFEIEREIFTVVADTVLATYSTCQILNKFVYAPDKFPCVSIVLGDDGTPYGMFDSSRADNFHDITLNVDVYSNKADGNKTEAEAIMQIIKDKLISLNFVMVSCKPNSNISNASIYRITATFTARVNASGNIFKRR